MKKIELDNNNKTTRDFWESVHSAGPKCTLPSRLYVGTYNLMAVLAKHIRPNMMVLEIGFAPGKQLAYVAKKMGAKVSGLDYSEQGMQHAEKLFNVLDIKADLRCEDVFNTTFSMNAFDVVYSVGVVEHFEDPSNIIRRHVELLRPGGLAVILIPNYGGVYGAIQRKLDPENLKIHNLGMMSLEGFARYAPTDLAASLRVYRTGKLNVGMLSLGKMLPAMLAKVFTYFFNLVGLIQPWQIGWLSPQLVLEVVKR